MTNEAARRLRLVRLLHTAVWAAFAGCIVAIPLLTWQGRFGAAAVLAAIVLGEVVVLWFHSWSCPLTAVAARYTQDRRANFDIYLPEWLARYNKQIFGPLYVAGVTYLVMRYLGAG
jgi:polyferredoxin